MEIRIEQAAEREVFANDYVTVYDDDVLFGGVFPGRYLRIVERDGKPGAAMLARCGDRFALVRTFRYPLGDFEWGIPRGFAQGDDPQATARGELAEELGGAPTAIIPLGVVAPNSGLLASRVHLFLADFTSEVAAPTDTGEVLAIRWLGLPELLKEIAADRVTDAFTLSALTAATARGLL